MILSVRAWREDQVDRLGEWKLCEQWSGLILIAEDLSKESEDIDNERLTC